MRLRLFLLLVFLCAVATAWACSLNPQPLPPDTNDASIDASLGSEPDAAGGMDGSTKDVGNPPPNDADASDASDAADDASDGSDDADASDARDDDVLDAGEPG